MEILLSIKLNDVMFFYISFIDKMMLNLVSFLFNLFYQFISCFVIFLITYLCFFS